MRYPQAYSPQATIAPRIPTSTQKPGPVWNIGWSTAWLICESVRCASNSRSSKCSGSGRESGGVRGPGPLALCGRLARSDIRLASLEIDHRRLGAQFCQEPEGTMAARQLAGPAVRVVQVTEDQRAGRTGFGAGRLNLAVGHRAALGPRLVLGAADALNAEGA